jgi:hypothetical protein
MGLTLKAPVCKVKMGCTICGCRVVVCGVSNPKRCPKKKFKTILTEGCFNCGK